jgi:hypothetical protein
MAVIPSPFSRRPSQNQNDDESFLDMVRGGSQGGATTTQTTVPFVAPTTGGNQSDRTVYDLQREMEARQREADLNRQLTPSELRAFATESAMGLIGKVPPSELSAQQQAIIDVSRGARVPDARGGVIAKAGQAIAYPFEKALQILPIGQKAVQSKLGAISEGLQQIAEGDVTGGLTKSVGQVNPVPVGSAGEAFSRRFNDPEYFITIPNIRDNIKIPSTGIGWLDKTFKAPLYIIDGAIEFGWQAGTDPLTYITFGAGAYTGTGGRAALAARLAQKDAIDLVPTLRGKIDDIYQRGEWALTRAERNALVDADIMQPAGLSWNFGDKATFGGRVSAELARAVGKPVSTVRAAVRRAPVMSKIRDITTGQKLKGLAGLAKGDVTGEAARLAVANYASGQAARGVYGRVSQTLASRHRDLIERLRESPYNREVGRIIEQGLGGSPVAAQYPPEAVALADEVMAMFADVRQTYNDSITQFMSRYGLDPNYATEIADVDNYFYHTLTPEAQRWLAAQQGPKASRFLNQITETLDIGAGEMRSGSGPIRGRKLKAGRQWLDEDLQYGTVEEINDIWRRKTGSDFDWFETDASSVAASYIDSVAHQAKRIAYADRLFDYGDDYILPLLSKVAPDKQLLAEARAVLAQLKGQRNRAVRVLTGGSWGEGGPKEAARALSGAQKLARKIITEGEGVIDQAEEKFLAAQTALTEARERLNKAIADAEARGIEINAAFDATVAPIKARISRLEAAIARGEGAREQARQVLLEEHARLFPRRKKRPTSVKTLAEEIAGENKNRFNKRMKELTTRRTRTEGRRATAEAKRAKAQGRIDVAEQAAEDVGNRARRLAAIDEATNNTDWELFPDGLMYTNNNYLMGYTEGVSRESTVATEWFNTSELDVEPDDFLIAVPAPSKDSTFDLAGQIDDVRDVVAGLPDALTVELDPRDWGAQGPEWAEWLKSETERLVAAKRGTEIDPRVPEELQPLIASIVGWGWQDDTSPEIFRLYADEIIEALNGLQEVAGRQVDPQVSEDLLHNALVRAAKDSGRGVDSGLAVIIPDGDDYRVFTDGMTARRVYSDPDIGGIEQGSQAWSDVVPDGSTRYIQVEPEPTVGAAAPTPAAAPAANIPTLDEFREALGWMFNGKSIGGSKKQEVDALFAEADKIASQLRAGKDVNYDKLIEGLDAVDDLPTKAYLVKQAQGRKDPFAEAIADRFEMEVEFGIGVAASGYDNGLRFFVDPTDPDYFKFVVGSADTLSKKNPPAYAVGLPDKIKQEIADKAASGGVPVEPTASTGGGTQFIDRTAQRFQMLEEQTQAARKAGEVREAQQPIVGAAEERIALADEALARVGRQESAAKGALTRAERKLGEQVAAAEDMTVRVDGKQTTDKQARASKVAAERKLSRAEKAVAAELKKDPVLKQVPKEQLTVDKAAASVDAAAAAVTASQEEFDRLLPLMQEDIDLIERLAAEGNQEFPDVQSAMAWARRVRDVTYQLNDPKLFDDRKLQDAWKRTVTAMFAQESQLAQLESQIDVAAKMVQGIKNAQVGAQLVKDIKHGWVELQRLGVQVPKELYDEWTAPIQKLSNPAEWNRFQRYYFGYQRFFKAYAISTPGFIVRNSLTAAFNNFVAGVSFEDTNAAIKFATNYYKHGLDEALNRVPAGQRAKYEEAFEAVARAGGGQAIDEIMPLVSGEGSRLASIYNNRYTRFFQKGNEAAEIGARMGMALDAVTRGLPLDANAARISRYHFDYSDLSRVDRVAKTIIPFWTYASRNAQLQMVNRIMRPSLYNRWDQVLKLTPTVDEESPLYLREREPIGLGGGWYLAPELPDIELNQQIARMTDPVLLLSQANPLIRSAVEGLAQYNLAFDYPYSQTQQQYGVTDSPSVLLGELIDQLSGNRTDLARREEGTATSWTRDLLPSMVPPLQQAQRYGQAALTAAGVPESTREAIGGRPSYQQRDPLSVLAAYLGVPVGKVDEQQLRNEALRRRFGIQDIVRRAVD